MISVGSRDERKGLSLRYGFEGEKMELQSEIEEGEACFQNNNEDDDDSTVDPDVSLSYIDEKIQNVLGHCQKDFEGGFSAENLGSKFGGYGSFLPMYQRSPVWVHPNTQPKDLNYSAPVSPNNALIEGGNQKSVSHSNASQSVRNRPDSVSARSGSAPRKSKSNSKLKQEVNTSSGSNKRKSVSDFADDPDQKSKVQIKGGSDNMVTKRNAEIYSGLGLDISPSSSLEASPLNSDWFHPGPRDGPDESPTSILEMMTSFPVSGSLLLSPLPDYVLHLTEKKSDDNSCGPVHKGSQESIMTAVQGSNLVKVYQNVVGEESRSTENNSVSVESTNGVLPKKEKSVDNFDPGNKTTTSGGKRKAEGGLKNEYFTSKTKKHDNESKSRAEDFKNNVGKVNETYKDFFGELDMEQELNDEMASEKPLEGNSVKGTLESNSLLKERSNGKKNRKLSGSILGNELKFDAAARTVVPVVNEDWVCCDKCEKWRLLPPGENPGSLPEKWICSMLDWLPGLNRCSISEEETTKAMTSHFPGPSVQGTQPIHPGGPHLGVISLDRTHQKFDSEIPSSVKPNHGLDNLTNEAKQDRPSLSSSSSKKKLHSHKTTSLNGVNHSTLVNEVEFQDSGQSLHVVLEKDKSKQEGDNKLCENFADEGNNIHRSKVSNKSMSTQDFPKKLKKNGNNEPSHLENFDKRDVLKKRKKGKEFDYTGKYVKGTGETNHRKEKKSRILKSVDEGISVHKVKNIEGTKLIDSSRQNTIRAATSSSSKVSSSHKTKPNSQESKGSPVESVSSSPMKILNDRGVNTLTKNVDTQPYEEKSSGRNKSKELLVNGNDSTQDSKKSSKKDTSIKRKSNSMPPKDQSENERKETAGNNLSLKELQHNKKCQNQNGIQHMNIKNPPPEKHEKSQDPTVVLVRDMSNQATTNALREATNLKHMADRLKNSGSSLESRALYMEAALKFLHALYMEAALKFLHVASLFESCHSQTGRYGDMIQSVSIYSSTAKLCKYCAHEYERTKEMTTTSLAYKCMEVAYMKVIYSSNATACKDVIELQTSLNIGLTGESPSSPAASDPDNLNNLKAADKAALAKGVNLPQVTGNQVIAAKNNPSLTRILNFIQNVNLAMEASQKSRIAFAACSSKEEVVVSAIKRALDFHFHDVEGLLHHVRVAMELINR